MRRLDAIGFGSLNLDEFWEVPGRLLKELGLAAGQEYIRDAAWFGRVYPALQEQGALRARSPGGSAANMIAALRRMGFTTGFYGAAGRADIESLRVDELADDESLLIRKTDLPTGRCLALISREDAQRDRALVILPNANDMAGAGEIPVAFFQSGQWVHLTSFISDAPLEGQKKLVSAIGTGVNVSFDPGAIYSARGMTALEPILQRTDVLFVTGEELEALTGAGDKDLSIRLLLDVGPRIIVLKLGADGMEARSRGEVQRRSAAPTRATVDRTGAGDAAAAGFIAGMLGGLDLGRSLELATHVASRSIEGYGRSAYPGRQFLEDFHGNVFPGEGPSY